MRLEERVQEGERESMREGRKNGTWDIKMPERGDFEKRDRVR